MDSENPSIIAADRPMKVFVDSAELAIRLCEASYGIKRPMANPRAALAAMDEDCRNGWLRAARAAFDYFSEIVNERENPQ